MSAPWCRSLGKNVAKAICYCNTMPLMLGLGGAQLRGQSVETVPISQQHLAVPFDASLHQRTIPEIEKLEPAGQNRGNVQKHKRILQKESSRIGDVKLRGLQGTHVRCMRLI